MWENIQAYLKELPWKPTFLSDLIWLAEPDWVVYDKPLMNQRHVVLDALFPYSEIAAAQGSGFVEAEVRLRKSIQK